MKRIRCVLVEDEKPSMDELRFLLESYEMIEIVGEADSGRRGYEMIKQMHPDLVFLDVSMPEYSGIELASKLMFLNERPEIVFTTAHSEYAVSAFELGALDYLLKPYDEKRIHKTMERIKVVFGVGGEVAQQSIQVERLEKYTRLPVAVGDKILLIDIEHITYCSTDKDHILVNSDQGQYNCHLTLNEITQKTTLFRIHRGTAVNLNHIREIYPWFNGTYQITLKDKQGSSLIVSRSYVKALKKELMI